jgi:hypothetical protein
MGMGASESKTGRTPIEKTLIGQVFDEMFTNIEGQEEFDAQMIKNLKQLAINGNLKKAAQITKAIKSASGEHCESS